jgi:hypothetical protein
MPIQMTIDCVARKNKVEDPISEFLAVDAQLHHSQEQLARVVAKLKLILTRLIEKRKSSATRTRTAQTRTGSRERISRLASRRYEFPCNVARDIEIRIHNENDAFLNSMNLSRQSICSPASFLSGSTIRPFTANSRFPLDHCPEGWVPPNILNRISLKVHDSWKHRRPATCHPTGFDDGTDQSTRRSRAVSHGEPFLEIFDINFLKLKIHELKTAEALALRKSDYSPKRLLSEYSPYGIRVNRNWKPLKPANPSNDATRELVTLIDRIDQQLSSNEALSTLKELGIDYQPRSAFGKKNMMASDFSMALGQNGLKLNDGTPSSPSKENTDRTLDSITSK